MKKIGIPILEASKICRQYKKTEINSFSLSVGKGNIISVLHNNAPAAALLTQILVGKEAPDKGKIFFKGDDVTEQRNNFGVVNNKPSLSKMKTITENGAVPLVKRGLSKSIAAVASQKELAAFGLENYGSSSVSVLPKNIAYRAELFLAYMWSHDIMIIDEPYSNFSDKEKTEELKWLKNVSEKTELAILVFTQSIDTAIALSDTVMAVNSSMSSVGMIGVDKNQPEKTRTAIESLLRNS